MARFIFFYSASKCIDKQWYLKQWLMVLNIFPRATHISSLLKYLFRLPAHFLNWIICFLIVALFKFFIIHMCVHIDIYIWASLVAQMVKNLPEKQETQVQSLGWEDPLKKEMTTNSSILTWRIRWTGEPGGLQSTESERVRYDWTANTPHIYAYIYDLQIFYHPYYYGHSSSFYFLLQLACCYFLEFSGSYFLG